MDIFSRLDTLEYPLIHRVQNIGGTFLDTFWMSISSIPIILGGFGLMILWMIWRKNQIWKSLLFVLIISLMITYSINEGFFKMFLTEVGIFRPRPWTIHTDIVAIGHVYHDSSFPSSHMAFTTLFVMIITYFEKRFLPIGIMIIILMGFSRVHNGMHYPTDVIVGILMGTMYAYIGLFFMKKCGFEKKSWWRKFISHR